jgi:uncharacterized protein DUF3313
MNTHVATAIGAAALTLLGTIASAGNAARTYDKLLIDDVDLSYDAASPLQTLTKAEARRIREAARAALTSAGQERFTIVAEPGPGVLRVHASISGIDAAKKGKHFWTFTPVGFVKSRVDVAGGADFVLRAATVRIAVSDAVSGELLPASADPLRGEAAAEPSVAASLHDLAAALETDARRALAAAASP